jgi:hypothetical protein
MHDITLVAAEKPGRLRLYVTTGGDPLKIPELLLTFFRQSKIYQQLAGIRMAGVCRQHHGVHRDDGWFQGNPIQRRAFLREILDNIRVTDHQRKLSGPSHLNAHRRAAHNHRLLSGQLGQITYCLLLPPTGDETLEEGTVIVVERYLAAFPTGLEQIDIGSG